MHRQIKEYSQNDRHACIHDLVLEGCQAGTKNSGTKEIKGKRRKARFLVTRLVIYHLLDNELAIRAFKFGLR